MRREGSRAGARAVAAALSLCVAAACSKDSPPKPTSKPAPQAARPDTATGDIAVVNVDGQILAVSLDGSTKPYVKEGAGWCATDNRAQVIWYTSDDELRFVDLKDGSSHLALTGVGEYPVVIIDYGDGVQVGSADEVVPDVGLHVKMSETPTVAGKILCDGDAWVYCYTEHAAAQEDKEILDPKLEAKRVKYDALKPGTGLAALFTRGAGRKLTVEGPKYDGPDKLEIDAAECYEDPESCGAIEALPSTPQILKITVGNSRGDYYHEDYRLYDASTQEFFLANDPSKRSKTPPKDEYGIGVEGMLVAPSGKAYLKGDVIATWKKVVWHVADAWPCGWIGPLYRVSGPRG